MIWYDLIKRRYRSYSCAFGLNGLFRWKRELTLNWGMLGVCTQWNVHGIGWGMSRHHWGLLSMALRFLRKHFRANDQWFQPRPRHRMAQNFRVFSHGLHIWYVLPGFATNRGWKRCTCWSTSATWAFEAALKAIQLWQWCGSTCLRCTACRFLSAFFPHLVNHLSWTGNIWSVIKVWSIILFVLICPCLLLWLLPLFFCSAFHAPFNSWLLFSEDRRSQRPEEYAVFRHAALEPGTVFGKVLGTITEAAYCTHNMTVCGLPVCTVWDSERFEILTVADSPGFSWCSMLRHCEEFGGEYNCRARTASTATTAAAVSAPAFVVPQKLHTQQPRVRPMREAKKWNMDEHGTNLQWNTGIQRDTQSLQKNSHLAANKHRLPKESLIHQQPVALSQGFTECTWDIEDWGSKNHELL